MLKGQELWYITDIWETLCIVPVTVKSVSDGYANIVWQITDNYIEEYEDIPLTELYSSRQEAEQAILAITISNKGD